MATFATLEDRGFALSSFPSGSDHEILQHRDDLPASAPPARDKLVQRIEEVVTVIIRRRRGKGGTQLKVEPAIPAFRRPQFWLQ
jgi:hypothetical protein